MKWLYLDESGDHSLDVVDPSYPVFVLGGVIVDDSATLSKLAEEVGRLKRDWFGREDIILRTADIRRNRNGFERLTDRTFRNDFYQAINRLMLDLDYKVVACAIQKDDHLRAYGFSALDPYMLSLHVVVERFFFELSGDPDGGVIVAERRSPTLDKQLELAWTNLLISGTSYLRGVQLNRRIHSLTLRHKTDNEAGLQLADLVISPIGRYVLGKPSHEDWSVIHSKFRRHRGQWIGPGLVLLPKREGPGPATQFPAH